MAQVLRPFVLDQGMDDERDSQLLLTKLQAHHEPHSGTRRPVEMLGVARAFRFLCGPGGRDRKELTVELITQTHRLLISPESVGGQLRTEDAFIGAHLFPPSHTIQASLERLVSSFNERRNAALSPEAHCALAAWLMYEVLAIHPFVDGNGRLSRLLLNWVLLSTGTAPFPVTFEREAGVVSSAHSKLMQTIVAARLSAGHPSVLATRVLLSLRNTWEQVYTQVDIEQTYGTEEGKVEAECLT